MPGRPWRQIQQWPTPEMFINVILPLPDDSSGGTPIFPSPGVGAGLGLPVPGTPNPAISQPILIDRCYNKEQALFYSWMPSDGLITRTVRFPNGGIGPPLLPIPEIEAAEPGYLEWLFEQTLLAFNVDIGVLPVPYPFWFEWAESTNAWNGAQLFESGGTTFNLYSGDGWELVLTYPQQACSAYQPIMQQANGDNTYIMLQSAT
jgi:hypothetical protein